MRPSGARKGWAIERWLAVLAAGGIVLTAAVQVSRQVMAPIWLYVAVYALAVLVGIAAVMVGRRQKRAPQEKIASAAYNLGILLKEQGDADGARKAFQQAIDSGHREVAPMAAGNLGVLLTEQGDADGARRAYQQAIDSGHHDEAPKAAVGLGYLLKKQGDADGARKAFQQAADSYHPDVASMAKAQLRRLG